MSNRAKLRIMFDRYSISSNAVKNFIKYFMNHSNFCIGVDTDGIVRTEMFKECSSHENDNYKFIISDIDGIAAIGEHKATASFNFNIRAETFIEYYSGFCIKIKKDSATDKVIMNFYYDGSLLMSYTADKTTWTEDKINRVFPDGLPKGVSVDSIQDFDTRIINEDYFDGTNTQIKEFFRVYGDSFDKDSISTTEDELEITLSGPMVLPAGSNTCTVSGTLSNSNTEESVKFDEEIFKLDKVNDNYELNIKSDKDFNIFDLTIKIVPKYSEVYAAIVQNDYSHTSGYNFQIPMQEYSKYKKGSKKLWHASVDNSVAVGMNFCNLLIGNKNTDEVKLKLIGYSRALASVASSEQGYFTVSAVIDGIEGNNYSLSMNQILSSGIITGVRIEIFESGKIIFASNITKKPNDDVVVIPVEDIASLVNELDSSKHFTDYLTPTGSKVLVGSKSIELQLTDGDKPKLVAEIYLNGNLYAKSYPKQVDSINEDSCWPATLLMQVFNDPSKGFIMTQFDEEGDITKTNIGLGDYIKIYNYDGEVSYLLLDFSNKDSTEVTFQPTTNYLLTHKSEGTLAAQMSNKSVKSNLTAFKTIYELDRDNRYMEIKESNFNIPVSLKIISTSGNSLDEDVIPYSNFVNEYEKVSPKINIEIPKPKDEIEYSLKTTSFTISKQDDNGEYEITNAYFKLGICALDGSTESTEELINSFIKKSCLTVHKIDYAANEKYSYYTFAIKPRDEYLKDSTFYSASEKFQLLDKSSVITDRNHLICNTALRPIVEVNSKFNSALRGVLYMDMFNADDDSIITTGWSKSESTSITIEGDTAIGKEILITKI